MKKIIAVAIISTLLVALSLYAVNAVIVAQQKSKQLEVSHSLLQYSEGLSQSVAQALKSLLHRVVIKPVSIVTGR